MKKKKKVILAKICPHASEHGIPYDRKFLSLALFYLKTYASRDSVVKIGIDFAIEIFDISADMENSLRRLYEARPDMVAYSAYLTEFEQTVRLAEKVKIVLPEVKQIIGGPSVRYPEKFLEENKCFDAVVAGEGEEPFTKIMRAFAKGAEFKGAASTTYRKGDNIVVSKEKPSRIEIDEIPIVFTKEFMRGTAGVAVCETSRGCMNNCKFCGLGLAGMRYHSLERIDHDLSVIFSRPEIRRIFIGDSNFFTDTERSMKILEIIQKRNKHKAQIEFYADFLAADEKLLARCRKVYVHDSLRIPIQTSSREALELAGRSWFDFDAVRDTVKSVMKHFPSTWGEIIIGLPGDNYEGIKTSIRWCAENGLHNIRCHRLKALPGSEYTKHPEKYGLAAGDAPPHQVYRSNTFLYAEMLRAEDLNRNYQIISPFIRTFDALNLKEIGIDIVNEAEALNPVLPEWDGLYSIDDEGNISETKAEAGLLLAGALGRRHKLPRKAVAFMKELFIYRHAQQSLYNYYKQNVIYNPEYIASERMISGRAPVIPMSLAVEFAYDVDSYLAGKRELTNPVARKYAVIFLYSRKENTAVAWHASSVNSLDFVIQNLGMLLSIETLKENEMPIAAGIARKLLVGGYVYFANENEIALKEKRACEEGCRINALT